MTPTEVLAALESCAIPNQSFRHEQHLAAAWEALRNAPLPEAAARICRALRRFATNAGKADRYHETVTWAYLVLVAERRHRLGSGADFAEFRAAFPELFDRERPILKALYSPELLASPLARAVFVLPDLPRRRDI